MTVTLNVVPTPTVEGALTVMPLDAGAPGEMLNCALDADGSEPSVAVRVYGPPTLVM